MARYSFSVGSFIRSSGGESYQTRLKINAIISQIASRKAVLRKQCLVLSFYCVVCGIYVTEQEVEEQKNQARKPRHCIACAAKTKEKVHFCSRCAQSQTKLEYAASTLDKANEKMRKLKGQCKLEAKDIRLRIRKEFEISWQATMFCSRCKKLPVLINQEALEKLWATDDTLVQLAKDLDEERNYLMSC